MSENPLPRLPAEPPFDPPEYGGTVQQFNNPWHHLPAEPPFVLPEDCSVVEAFNHNAGENYHLYLNIIPEPFVGSPRAGLVLLGNIGGGGGPEFEGNAAYKETSVFINRMRGNLLHTPSPFPFVWFDPDRNINPPPEQCRSGEQWWVSKLRDVLAQFNNRDVGKRILAQAILSVEFFPYSAHQYCHDGLHLGSQAQQYSFDLVRDAMRRGAVIVLRHGRRRWIRAIPELDGYRRLVQLREPQRGWISCRNCRGNGWAHILEFLHTLNGAVHAH